MEKEIIVKPNFIFKDYFKINLYLLVNKPYYYIIGPLSILFLSFDIHLIYPNEKKLIELLFFPDVCFLALPLLIIWAAYSITKSRLSNKKLEENIYIKFNSECIEDVGESFNMKYYWREIFKIVEKENWFLIYLNKKSAKVIRKADLVENQYNELKELFNSLNIKKSLK
ncbi:YcxB family protein [Flavobacterium sp.]|uniref:YcxB family protein n=1 Tax=Flavobacterium sp. TaxID=239 RepID=UPI0038CF6890